MNIKVMMNEMTRSDQKLRMGLEKNYGPDAWLGTKNLNQSLKE